MKLINVMLSEDAFFPPLFLLLGYGSNLFFISVVYCLFVSEMLQIL